MTHDDEHDEPEGYVPSVGDVLTRWRYTLVPTLYVSEDSSTSDLLWQQVLEQRATRAWLIVLWMTLAFLGMLGVVALFVLTASGGNR